MQLLFRTWNHIIPLAVVTNKTLKFSDIVEINKKKYCVTCEPGNFTPGGKRIRFYYCVKAANESETTNTVHNGGKKKMIDYRDSIKSVCEEHDTIISKDKVEEINDALNDLITDYVTNDDMDETDADKIISENFWDYVRECM